MSWKINSNDKTESDELHRRHTAGQEFAEKLFRDEAERLANSVPAKSSLRKDILDHGVYSGIASELIDFIDRANQAGKQTVKTFPKDERKVKAMSLLTISHMIKLLIENEDKIKRL